MRETTAIGHGSHMARDGARGAVLPEEYNMKRGMVFGGIIVAAMLAFELFNYSTTDFALSNLLGDLRFAGLRWATILAIAFCGMDFAGLARLFTPERGRGERVEVWYLVGAWFLAAIMNAALTWWGVSLALLNHAGLGNEILSRDMLLSVVPVFVAVLVWLIRILLIGLLSMAGERLFSQREAVEQVAGKTGASRVPAGASLPTAAWGGTSQRPQPVRTHSARPAMMGGDDAMTVAERHGYGQSAAPARPVAPQPPPVTAVRPVPKPATGMPIPSSAARPVMARVGAGNGHGNGNGSGHANTYHDLDED